MMRTETTITPRITRQVDPSQNEQSKSIISPTGSATGGIEFRLNKSSIDLSHAVSPRMERKSIVIPDLNGNASVMANKFCFPDLNIKTNFRRSSSAHRLRTPLEID
jgi:hypothetical protein